MDLLEALERADLILADGTRYQVVLRHRIAQALMDVAPKAHDCATCHVCIHNRAALATTA